MALQRAAVAEERLNIIERGLASRRWWAVELMQGPP